jgi:hypothetical protein
VNAVATHFQTNLSAWEEHNQPAVNQGPSSGLNHHPNVEGRYMSQFPSELQGFRCYTDASISMDHLTVGARQAGLGIFIATLICLLISSSRRQCKEPPQFSWLNLLA